MNIEKSFETTYPEQDAKTFINMMLRENTIQKGQIENNFIRATRGDAGVGLKGQLCRGEFMETLLRCAQNWVQMKHPTCYVSDFIDDFFDLAITPYYK